jgi:hypothetical protein
MRAWLLQFIRSRSGQLLLMYLAWAALVSGGIGYGFYHSSLQKFLAHKAEEKVTALRLVEAFVTTYSGLRSEFGPNAPVPATFRAHSIESFNRTVGGSSEFLLRWVGRAGRQIVTPPADADMARIIEGFASKTNPRPESALTLINGRLVFRTVYPSLAREQSCVTCHNKVQRDEVEWKLNDVMGAFAIDIPAQSFLESIQSESRELGFGLFMALAAIGLGLSIISFRQEREPDMPPGLPKVSLKLS